MFESGWLSQLKQSLGGRRVVPPDPPGHISRMLQSDPAEIRSVPHPDSSSSWSAFIAYGNAAGEDSARVITIRRIDGHYGRPETLHAFCHLRRKHRAFRIDRISAMACAVTGEELDPVEQCLALHRSGALKIEDKALTRLSQIVTFMARCDGDFHALELAALEEMMTSYALRFGGDDVSLRRAMKECRRLAPSSNDLMNALRALKKMPEGPRICRFALTSCAAIVDADGQHRPEEIEWGAEVASALKIIAGRA